MIITICQLEIFLPLCSDYLFVMNVTYSEWLFSPTIKIFNIWYKNAMQNHSYSSYPLLCSPLFLLLVLSYVNKDLCTILCGLFYEILMCFGNLVYLSVHSSHDSITGTNIVDTDIIFQHPVALVNHSIHRGILVGTGLVMFVDWWYATLSCIIVFLLHVSTL
jgi:hypothetical protein